MCRLTWKTKRGIISNRKEEKGEKEAPLGWILGRGKSPPSFLSLWPATALGPGSELWGLEAYLEVSDMTSYSLLDQSQFSLFWHSEVLLNSRIGVSGDQKEDKTREGRCALYQENLKSERIGSEAARERMMEELTRLFVCLLRWKSHL